MRERDPAVQQAIKICQLVPENQPRQIVLFAPRCGLGIPWRARIRGRGAVANDRAAAPMRTEERVHGLGRREEQSESMTR